MANSERRSAKELVEAYAAACGKPDVTFRRPRLTGTGCWSAGVPAEFGVRGLTYGIRFLHVSGLQSEAACWEALLGLVLADLGVSEEELAVRLDLGNGRAA